MSDRKNLLTIEFHSDDDSGMYKVGEIDFGINARLGKYFEEFGLEGKKNLIGTMGYLIYEVERMYREQNKPESPQSNK